MSISKFKELVKKILASLCLGNFAGLLLAGLWPLNFSPKNEVEWLNENGLEFHRAGVWSRFAPRGVIYTIDPFSSTKNDSCQNDFMTIELLLRSEMGAVGVMGHLLAFVDDKEMKWLVLAEWKTSLIIRKPGGEIDDCNNNKEIALINALPKGEMTFLTITSGPNGTTIYLNGTAIKDYPGFSLNPGNSTLTKRLVLGNALSGKSPWAGKLYGLAIYNKQITMEQAAYHHKLWPTKKLSGLCKEDGLVALYPFDEGSGCWVYNQVADSNHLFIPSKFPLFNNDILVMPFDNIPITFENARDIFINIIGFIPTGLILIMYFYFSGKSQHRHSNYLTIILGGLASLTIELLQVGLPQRTSSLLDLSLNIIGTALGLLLFYQLLPLIHSIKNKSRSYLVSSEL